MSDSHCTMIANRDGVFSTLLDKNVDEIHNEHCLLCDVTRDDDESKICGRCPVRFMIHYLNVAESGHVQTLVEVEDLVVNFHHQFTA